MEQRDLFATEDPAQVAADEAIAKVESNANPLWKKAALEAIHSIASSQQRLTTDDVWRALEAANLTTHEPRALGAVMRTATKKRWISTTDAYKPSSRPECHGRPIRIWKSHVYTERY